MTMVDTSDLARRAVTGDERAFAELVNAFRGPILRHLHGLLRDSDAAEDVWQDVQFRVWRNLAKYDDSRKFSTWIYTIATNTALNEIRRRNRHKCLVSLDEIGVDAGGEDRIPEIEDQRGGPDSDLDDLDLNAQLAAAVLELPEINRRTLILREIGGRSYEEIAEETATSMGTVKSRLHRARAAVASRVA
jgi:RNA polymerase sigma-70 factor (ECF subfamily)